MKPFQRKSNFSSAKTKHKQNKINNRPTTVKWRQFSQSNRHPTIGTRQTEYQEALPSSANDEVRCDCTFADDGNALWYSPCRVSIVEWQLDCENCRHLMVVGLHDTGPWCPNNERRAWLHCPKSPFGVERRHTLSVQHIQWYQHNYFRICQLF